MWAMHPAESPKRIVVTGGPCAGKTTALGHIQRHLSELGYHPLMVPEVPTELIIGGFVPGEPDFQEFVMEHTLATERVFLKRALRWREQYPERKCVLIHDRGLPDQKAYTRDAAHYAHLCGLNGLDLAHVLQGRYDAVVFMRTAACGAETHYTTSNNAARRESSLEIARAVDQATLNAWIGTPHLRVVENNQTFEDKIRQTIGHICDVLGEPVPIERERKYKLSSFSITQLPEHSVPVDIVQTYLVNPDGFAERVRARGQHGSMVYFHTIKEPTDEAGVMIERDRMISVREYNELLNRRDRTRLPVKKTRHCFVYAGQYCEVDVFYEARHNGLVMLEVEVTKENPEVNLPPCLSVECDVTEDKRYGNHALALVA